MWQMINFKKLVGVLNEIEEQAVLLEIPITSIDKINDVYIDITFDIKINLNIGCIFKLNPSKYFVY